MKNHEIGYYLDKPGKDRRFFDWRRWVELLPALSRATLPAQPRVTVENDQRIQQYLNALRDTGAPPPVSKATKPARV
jgi:hypothetical protein